LAQAQGSLFDVLKYLKGLFLLFGVITATGIVVFVADAGRDRDRYFLERRGTAIDVAAPQKQSGDSALLRLVSDAGLDVMIRVIRPAPTTTAPLRTLLIIGGHRTGSRAVELADRPACCNIVAIDYPMDGELESDTLASMMSSVTSVRRAALDTVPAISLAVTWLEKQEWVDKQQIELVGASLGVPFATTAAALDARIDKLWLIHGAADNYAWIHYNVGLRGTGPLLQPVYTRLIYWLLYADSFDTGERIRSVAPRPVVIIGARDDERTPAGQTETLFALAGEPKELLWTDGAHIEPDRSEIVNRLLRLLQVR